MSGISKRARQAARQPIRLVRQAAAEAQAAVQSEPPQEPTVEVWQWTRRKYRVRAIVLLLLNAALFAGLGCFTFWLRTGALSPLGVADYGETWWQAFDPYKVPPVTLIDFLTYPIPVDQVPFMMIIVALVLASLTAIPILVSMLYRFPFSLLFTAIICFVAVVPWLAITVTFCCLLARWRPLRFSFHYATALISLVPLGGYYALATRSPAGASVLAPMELARYYVPWVMALIGACVLMGLVLTIAKLVNYRPGAIAPLMAVMFAVPVVLFETKVGKDELYYRLIEDAYGPRSRKHFVDYTDAMPVIQRIADRRLESMTDNPPSRASMIEQVRLALDLQLAWVQPERDEEGLLSEEAFATEQLQAVRQCDAFIARYPNSRYVPNVQYLKGRALDLRVDHAYFRRTAIIRHYQDFPNMASLETWRTLWEGQVDPSTLAIVAGYRVALLEARRGRMDESLQVLEALLSRHDRAAARPAEPAAAMSWRSFFAKKPPSRALEVDPAAVLLEARKLRSLIKFNRDPQQKDLPLQSLLSLNPRHPLYQSNLRQLLDEIPARYPLTPLRDNLEVLIATVSAGPSRSRRIELLKACVDEFSRDPKSDALPMAQFELGVAYKADSRLDEARAVFEELSKGSPDSPWSLEAKQQLAAMGAGKT